jgi:hypothetical protein
VLGMEFLEVHMMICPCFWGKKKELKFKFFRLKHLDLDFSIIKATFSD